MDTVDRKTPVKTVIKQEKNNSSPGRSTSSPFCKGGSSGIFLDSARAYRELTKKHPVIPVYPVKETL